MEAKEAVGLFVGLEDEAEVARGGGAGGQSHIDRTSRGTGRIRSGKERLEGGIQEGIASGSFALELLPGGGGDHVLALDGKGELFFAVELEVIFEVGKGSGDPGADGALGDAQLR